MNGCVYKVLVSKLYLQIVWLYFDFSIGLGQKWKRRLALHCQLEGLYL